MEGVPVTSNTFHWADYLVFAAFLVFSLGIGVYYGIFAGKKQKTAKDFLLGGQGMQVFPVAMAIMSSFLSAILILGTPAEIYTKGTMYWMYTFGMIGAVILATVFFIPLLYPLKLTSSYEYLEERFNSYPAKLTGTLILFATQILYLGIAMYSPSTALEAVTGFPEWATIIIGGFVAMFYTAVGGMKASVWASAFQTLIMAAGVIMVIVKGCIDVGGIDKMWELNSQGNRIEFFECAEGSLAASFAVVNILLSPQSAVEYLYSETCLERPHVRAVALDSFNTDPLERHSFWTLIVGGTIGWLSTYGVNQASVQRYSAMPTQGKARAVVLLNIPGLLFFMTICVLSGMVIFAYYSMVGCDPLAAGYIKNPNQLIPYYVMDRLNIPGIPGLFLACLFGGALSSVSASLSALSAVTWQDMLSPLKPFREMSDAGQTIVTKLLVVIYGGIGIGMAFMSANLGGTVLQASLSFTGASGGPLLGLFVLGAFFPCANKYGAIIGGLIGLAIPLWISIGAYSLAVSDYDLPTTTAMCLNATLSNATEPLRPEDVVGFERVYLISYLWYPAIGMSIVVVLGLLITMVTDCRDPSETSSKYLIPFFDRLFCCLPKKTLRVLRCNKDFSSGDDEKQAQPSYDTDTKDKADIPMSTITLDDNIYDNPAMLPDPSMSSGIGSQISPSDYYGSQYSTEDHYYTTVIDPEESADGSRL